MKMTRYGLSAALAVALGWSNSAYAVPTLQLGLCLDNPVSSSCSTYRANQDIGGDEDTAFTTSDPFTLSIGGVQSKDEVVQLGEIYSDGGRVGADWSDFGLPTVFDGRGAILVVSAPDGLLTEDYAGAPLVVPLTVNGNNPFYVDEANSYKGDQHFPAKDSVADFLFFDIENIFGPLPFTIDNSKPNNLSVDVDTSPLSQVPNFQDPGSPNNLGAVSLLNIVVDENLVDWLHFDVIALETSLDFSKQGGTATLMVSTDDESNPNSKDVTWYKNGGEPPIPPSAIPEPNILWLLGAGLVGAGLTRKFRRMS